MTLLATANGKAPKYKLEALETILDFNEEPHRMVKMVISGSGDQFPIRDAPIFVRIRDHGETTYSWLVELSADSTQIIAFFPVDFKKTGQREFGYGDQIWAVFQKPRWQSFQPLDTKRIDKGVITVNQAWLDRMKHPKNK